MYEVVTMAIDFSKVATSVFGVALSFTAGVLYAMRWAMERVRQIPRLNAINLSFAAIIAALLFAGGAFIYVSLPHEDETVMGPYTSPAQVLSTVDGVNGPDGKAVPAVRERDEVVVRVTRCINADDLTKVLVTRGFFLVSDPGNPHYDLVFVEQSRSPGCTTADVPIILPAEVTPGLWIVASEEATTTGDEDRKWTSEPFTVVPSD